MLFLKKEKIMMNTIKGLYLLGIGGLILSTAVVCPPAAGAQTIHAMLIVMNDALHTQELNETNLVTVVDRLEEIKEELGCNLTVDSFHPLNADSEHDATRENILNWLAAVRPARDDVVFVYYSGGGGTADETRELFLTLKDGNFPRKQLAEAINGLPCRLKMLITDTFSFNTLFLGRYPLYPSPYTTTDAYRSLFLEHEGFLNITSATEGELSGGTASVYTECSWFTSALLSGMIAPQQDFNGDGFVSWTEVFEAVRNKTSALFSFNSELFSEGLKRKLDRIGQRNQRPKYYGQLPRRSSSTAAPPTDTQILHALFMILDKEGSYLEGMKAMERLLEDVVETTHCNFKKAHLFASKQEMTSANIQQWLKTLRPGRNDVVFIYYNGHGHTGESGELYLTLLDNENFPRKAIAESMQQVACRLKILITDSGSQGTPVTEPLDVFASFYRAKKGENKSLHREQAYTHLFFEHEGFLNLTAATEGERAFEDLEGGWFTRSLVKAIYEFTELDSDFDFFISWAEVFQRTRQETMNLFYMEAPDMDYLMKQQLRAEGVRSQRPKYYGELPKRISH